jgi:hypothetical protein
VTPEDEALRSLVTRLTDSQVPYMITGSVASSHHGRPRSTHDIDVVVDPSASTPEELIRSLANAGFYVDAVTARDALRRRRLFNVIEDRTAVKIDLIIRKDRPFSREEFDRRQAAELGAGLQVSLATPEDTVLSKLEWSRLSGGSEKQLADVAGILDVQEDRLDFAYIERWAEELGVMDLWRAVAGSGRSTS